jgi:quercetin dioxygenase-like cupin family protein
MKFGQTIRKDATGETLTMLVSEEGNGGDEYQLYKVQLPSRQSGPPLHYHVDFAETFTVNEGKLDIYLGKDRKHLLLQTGDNATAEIKQPHKFANHHDEPVIFTVQTKPPGGVVKAFQFAYGIANDGGGDADGLSGNPIARLVFIKRPRVICREFRALCRASYSIWQA